MPTIHQRLSIVIPTYGRDDILCDTVRSLLALTVRADEIVVVDQTPEHDGETNERLDGWDRAGDLRWIRLEKPSITGAMNRGAQEAKGEVVLFLDDDLISHPDLVQAHRRAYENHPEAWAVVGQVLQPEDWGKGATEDAEDTEEKAKRQFQPRMARMDTNGQRVHRSGSIRDDSCNSWLSSLGFAFNGKAEEWVGNVMAGNLSVRRERFLEVGGFDERFGPPVAYRFETEFAKRILRSGGRIWFEPGASIRHLRASRGGTRSSGRHLTSMSPVHGVGDYYYALRCGRGLDRILYLLRRPFREVRTRFHLRHPWWIPVKFIGELRAMLAAFKLYRQGPKIISTTNCTNGHE